MPIMTEFCTNAEKNPSAAAPRAMAALREKAYVFCASNTFIFSIAPQIAHVNAVF
jgi:hypothetical protein